MLADLVHEDADDIHRNAVHTVVVVAVFREITLHLVVHDNTVFITDALYLCILDGTEGIRNNGETCNTCRKVTLDISVMQCHLQAFVAVFVMHIMNDVQCIDIQSRKPFHHLVVLVHDIVKVQIIALNGSVFRAYLHFHDLIHAAVDGVEQAFCKVCSCTEELHFLTDAHRRYAAGNCIVVTMCYTHQIVILILNGGVLDGHFGTELFKIGR